MTRFKKLILALLLSYSPYHYADTSFTKLDGENLTLSALKGKWVFINYWASWCPSCLDEIREFNLFQEHHKNKAMVLAVNFDYLPKKELAKLVKDLHIKYPSLLTDPGKTLGFEAIDAVPMTFVLDPKGRLKTTLYGAQTEQTLVAALR